jgi:adenylosuccinate lyase
MIPRFPHLVRDRGARHRRAGRAGRGAQGAAKKIWEKGKDAKFDVARIDEIEREVTKHDVIAFLTISPNIVGPEARFVHQGMTSSDVLDTCLPCSWPAPPTC